MTTLHSAFVYQLWHVTLGMGVYAFYPNLRETEGDGTLKKFEASLVYKAYFKIKLIFSIS